MEIPEIMTVEELINELSKIEDKTEVPDFYKNQFKKLEDDTKADMEG